MDRSWYQWHPITELDAALRVRRAPSLEGLAQAWKEERESMQELEIERAFLERWKNRLAVEPGVLEGLYSLDAGVTETLIERGFDAARRAWRFGRGIRGLRYRRDGDVVSEPADRPRQGVRLFRRLHRYNHWVRLKISLGSRFDVLLSMTGIGRNTGAFAAATSLGDPATVRKRFAGWLRADMARALASWQQGL